MTDPDHKPIDPGDMATWPDDPEPYQRTRDPDPDDETRDANGLTDAERARWETMYVAIASMVEMTIGEAPTPDEARRRLAVIQQDLALFAAAVTANAPTWNAATPAAHTTQRTL